MSSRCVLTVSAFLAFAFLMGCAPKDDEVGSLRQALIFYASFDDGANADFAYGNPTLYSLVSSESEVVTKEGLPEEVRFKDSGGDFGKCLSFNTPEGVSGTRAFFELKDNFPYADSDWSGTVSFWLRLAPKEDLRPGFTDPIQLTSKSALDAGIWVDFDREADRDFRMGAFPDKAVWNPENKRMTEIPNEGKPWVAADQSAFSRDRWTHVAIAIEGFNNSGKEAVATLYLDGVDRGSVVGWTQKYSWDIESAQIRLGVNFVGDLDELSCFDRALTPTEIEKLFSLGKGLSELAR